MPYSPLEDVARAAALSVQTVEAALEDPDTVTREDRVRIAEALEETGFKPPRRWREKMRPAQPAPGAGEGSQRTKSGLPVADTAALNEQGRRQIRGELAGLITAARAGRGSDPWMALLRPVSAVLQAADAELDEIRPVRDRAMLAAYLFDGVTGVDRAAGISPTTFYQMREKAIGQKRRLGDLTLTESAARARDRGLEPMENAAGVLVMVAPRVLVLNGRREEAVALQKEASLAAHAAGVPYQEIVEAMGKSEGRFWQWHAEDQEERRKARGA